MEPATPLISDHTENDNNFKILKSEPSNFILQLGVLNSFSLSKGTKIKIDQFGLVEGSLRNMRDGITYFGYNGTKDTKNNEGEINKNEKEDNSLDYLLPIKRCNNPGRFFKIQYLKKLNEYILKDLNKGIGTFIKIQDSMYLRNKSIINIGDVYLVIIFCDKGENINNINKNDIYGFNCDLKIKVYNNNEKEYYYEKEKEKDIKIGRVNYANDIELNDSLASKVNCVIRYNNIKGWIIKDGSDSILKNGEIMRNFSKNGTWISVNDNIQITDKMIFKSNFNIFKCDFLQV